MRFRILYGMDQSQQLARSVDSLKAEEMVTRVQTSNELRKSVDAPMNAAHMQREICTSRAKLR